MAEPGTQPIFSDHVFFYLILRNSEGVLNGHDKEEKYKGGQIEIHSDIQSYLNFF